MSINLVGLTGFAQAGKDTVAQVLVKEYGFVRVAFADAVRDALYALDPDVILSSVEAADLAQRWDIEYQREWSLRELVNLLGWDEAKKLSEVRRLMQYMGTEVGRKVFGEDIWVDTAFEKVDAHHPSTGVVLTDVRFPNEATRIADEGGVLIYVHRDVPRLTGDHTSENLAEEMAEYFEEFGAAMDWRDLDPSVRSPYHHAIDNRGTLDELRARVHYLAIEGLGLRLAGES